MWLEGVSASESARGALQSSTGGPVFVVGGKGPWRWRKTVADQRVMTATVMLWTKTSSRTGMSTTRRWSKVLELGRFALQ